MLAKTVFDLPIESNDTVELRSLLFLGLVQKFELLTTGDDRQGEFHPKSNEISQHPQNSNITVASSLFLFVHFASPFLSWVASNECFIHSIINNYLQTTNLLVAALVLSFSSGEGGRIKQ